MTRSFTRKEPRVHIVLRNFSLSHFSPCLLNPCKCEEAKTFIIAHFIILKKVSDGLGRERTRERLWNGLGGPNESNMRGVFQESDLRINKRDIPKTYFQKIQCTFTQLSRLISVSSGAKTVGDYGQLAQAKKVPTPSQLHIFINCLYCFRYTTCTLRSP